MTARMIWLFIVMCLAGALGGAAGSMLGHALGGGGLIAGGVVGGLVLIAAAGVAAARIGWIRSARRAWAILGAEVGFVAAVFVALATLSSPVGPLLGTLLIGVGAVLGAELGKSAHRRLDA